MAADVDVGHYKTSDMALASYLKYMGHEPQKIAWDGDTCFWHFRETPHILECVDTFARGAALMEPKEYNRLFGRTKREFYDNEPGRGPNHR